MTNTQPKQPSPIDVIVGQNIRRIRTQNSMSQSVLADALGITFQQVQKYEKGTNRVGSSRLIAIRDALGCTIDDLYSGVGKSNTNEAPSVLKSRTIKLAVRIDKLSAQALELLERQVSLCEQVDAAVDSATPEVKKTA